MSENLNPIVLEVEEVRVINAVSPTVDVQRIENGAEVTIHDYRGTQVVEIYDGEKGDAYILTQADREEIAGIAEENFSAEVKQWHDTVVEKAGQVSTDKGIVEGYMERSETAAGNAESSANAAHTSEMNSSASATVADNSASAAHTSEVNAAGSALSAAQSASAASGSETAAAESATNAANSASAASGSATAAHTSEVNAAQSETNAGNSARAAAQSAQAASQSATNAAQSEQNAADSAQDAHDVLDSIPEDYSTLSTDVTNLKSAVSELESLDNAPAIIETASGAIASFDDGADDRPMKSLVAHIEPVQDLHGYDHPWPGGGGKNLLKLNVADGETSSGVTFTINDDGSVKLTGTSTSTNIKTDFATATLPAGTYIISHGQGQTGVYLNVPGKANSTATGASFTIDEETEITVKLFAEATGNTFNGNIYPMIRLASETDATFAPYSNICPISGWTGVKVFRDGANLLPLTLPSDAFHGTFGTGDTTIEDATNAWCWCMYVGKNTKLYYQNESVGTALAIAFSDVYMVSRNDSQIHNALNCTSRNNVVSDSGEHPYLIIQISNADSLTPKTGGLDSRSCMLSFGESRKTYEPRRNLDTYTITFPVESGTVYGGTLDVVKGELVVTHVGIPVDGTPNQWISGYSEGIDGNDDWLNARLNAFIGNNLSYGHRIPPSDYFRCSFLPYKYTNVDGTVHFYKTTHFQLFLPKTVFPDIATFVSWLNANPQNFWIKLINPITYTLTPTEIRTLLGQNNVWADTGDSDVTYQADTKMYIDKKFTELQALILENIGG